MAGFENKIQKLYVISLLYSIPDQGAIFFSD